MENVENYVRNSHIKGTSYSDKFYEKIKFNKTNRVLTEVKKNQNSHLIQWLKRLIKFVIYSRNIFTFLVCNGARGFAGRLAGCLAFPATGFVAVIYSAVY